MNIESGKEKEMVKYDHNDTHGATPRASQRWHGEGGGGEDGGRGIRVDAAATAARADVGIELTTTLTLPEPPPPPPLHHRTSPVWSS